jgi:hypothetical protein
METHKHTPGPWTVEDWEYKVKGREHVPVIVSTGSNDAVAEALGLWRNGEDSEEERNANARLIAAAPDLLEALQGFVNHFPDGDDGMEKAVGYGLDSELFAARVAIAQATGK